jgi:hypothetical protein
MERLAASLALERVTVEPKQVCERVVKATVRTAPEQLGNVVAGSAHLFCSRDFRQVLTKDHCIIGGEQDGDVFRVSVGTYVYRGLYRVSSAYLDRPQCPLVSQNGKDKHVTSDPDSQSETGPDRNVGGFHTLKSYAPKLAAAERFSPFSVRNLKQAFAECAGFAGLELNGPDAFRLALIYQITTHSHELILANRRQYGWPLEWTLDDNHGELPIISGCDRNHVSVIDLNVSSAHRVPLLFQSKYASYVVRLVATLVVLKDHICNSATRHASLIVQELNRLTNAVHIGDKVGTERNSSSIIAVRFELKRKIVADFHQFSLRSSPARLPDAVAA